VLTTRGLTAWARTLRDLARPTATTCTPTSTPIGTANTASTAGLTRQRGTHEPPAPLDLPPGVAGELINALAAIALAAPAPP
jgi:hypothetical protein